MDKIRRREFTGSWLFFTVLCISGVGLPIAFIYLVNSTVEIETEMENAEEAWSKIRK